MDTAGKVGWLALLGWGLVAPGCIGASVDSGPGPGANGGADPGVGKLDGYEPVADSSTRFFAYAVSDSCADALRFSEDSSIQGSVRRIGELAFVGGIATGLSASRGGEDVLGTLGYREPYEVYDAVLDACRADPDRGFAAAAMADVFGRLPSVGAQETAPMPGN